MNKIQKLTQAIRDNVDIDYPTLQTLKMIDNESLKMESKSTAHEAVLCVLKSQIMETDYGTKKR